MLFILFQILQILNVFPTYCIYTIITFNSFGEGKGETQYPFILLQPFNPFYYSNFACFHIYPPCIALPFIHLLYFNYIFLLHLILIFLNNLYFSYFDMCISSSFLNQGTNSFPHKGNVMIPNHAQPAYSQGRMHRRFRSEVGTVCETRRSVNPCAAFA